MVFIIRKDEVVSCGSNALSDRLMSSRANGRLSHTVGL